MKTLVTICAIATLVMVLSATVQATETTITFDPDVLIQSYPSAAGDEDVVGENKLTQLNARRIQQPWASGTLYETFYNPANPQTQPDSYNTYMNWRDGLGAGEGIAMFNSWFLGWSGAATWGETVIVKPGTTVSGTAAGGWSWRVVSNPYGAYPDGAEASGDSIQWWTTDSTKYINTLSTIGNFSITADLYYDTNGNKKWDVDDVGVDVDDTIRMWLGCLNGDDAPYYRTDTQALYFDAAGWGTRTSSVTPFAADYSTGAGDVGSGFEAMIIPEPATMLLLGLGGVMGLVSRKRRV